MSLSKLLYKYALKPMYLPRNFTTYEARRRLEPKLLIAERPIRPLIPHNLVHLGRITRKDLPQPIIRHPNFKKAAAIIQLLEQHLDDTSYAKPPPHCIGKLPQGPLKYEGSLKKRKTPDALVKLVRAIIKQASRDKTSYEKVNFLTADLGSVKKHGKVRVKSTADDMVNQKPGEPPLIINIFLDSKGIKEKKEPTMKQPNVPEIVDEVLKENEMPQSAQKFSKSKDIDIEETPDEMEYNEENRTARSLSRNVEDQVKEVASNMTPVSTSGFSRYLEYWRQIFAKKTATKMKENPKIESNETSSTAAVKKNDPYEPKMEQDAEEEESTRADNPSAKSIRNYQQKSHYCTMPCAYTKTSHGPTSFHISELEKFAGLRPYTRMVRVRKRCDDSVNRSSGSQNESKHDPNRVEEFVGKFKQAVSRETDPDFKQFEVKRALVKGLDPAVKKVKVKKTAAEPEAKKVKVLYDSRKHAKMKRVTNSEVNLKSRNKDRQTAEDGSKKRPHTAKRAGKMFLKTYLKPMTTITALKGFDTAVGLQENADSERRSPTVVSTFLDPSQNEDQLNCGSSILGIRSSLNTALSTIHERCMNISFLAVTVAMTGLMTQAAIFIESDMRRIAEAYMENFVFVFLVIYCVLAAYSIKPSTCRRLPISD